MNRPNEDNLTVVRETIETAQDAGLISVIQSLNSDQKETLDLAVTSFLAGVNAALAATRRPA